MLRPVSRLGLAAVATLALAVPVSAFPVKVPPVRVKVPPAPYVHWALRHAPPAYWVSGGGSPMPHTGKPLETARKDVKAARNELADKNHLSLSGTSQKVRDAEKLVEQQQKIANADKNTRRADALDRVVKDLQEADRQIAAHQVDKARDALGKADRELGAVMGGKPPAKKKDPTKKK